MILKGDEDAMVRFRSVVTTLSLGKCGDLVVFYAVAVLFLVRRYRHP
jgi:hypothetical protein